MAIVRWLLLAFQFTTIVPTPEIHNVSEQDIRKSVVWFPIIGGLLGGVLWLSDWFFSRYLSSMAASALSLTLYTWLTGALHLDGLMDTADALGSRRSREIALEIMKDSRIGAMGAVAALLLLIGKFSALSSLSPPYLGYFVVVPMFSRLSMVWSMAFFPSARQEGLGWFFSRKLPFWVTLAATCMTLLLSVLLLPIQEVFWFWLVSVFVVLLFNGWMFKKFAGNTGDTYGALNEIVEWVGWMLLVFFNR
ncbi:adenosylcobinamide-GDP ribazoletransferase [Alicyclobacillus tolerans]|uniref:Adenosylcobinamide-GDP ribazoletransferase n=1 Tax=Alicyclobacillus tolerans TaxID=90970 RepID=A0ABT9LSI4_9BACL|nr:adenosylcobinamide-GDP ribazoletransferase [Alicyclobacillus tengchongensis]MDP9727220.1 adenosylcobinamide-GDP ribazoletransferase [Alicyclobacillus tengchongensis]